MKTPFLASVCTLLCFVALMDIQGCTQSRTSEADPKPNQAADQKIQEAVTDAIFSLHRTSIIFFGVGGGGQVIVTNGNVTLLGTVVSESDRLAAGEAAREATGVRQVSNLLAVWPEASYQDSHNMIQLTHLSTWPFEMAQPAGLQPDATPR
ncbi:MAG TPA: BON domain-containing protein [Candidatus Binatia bacterium]|nr:BON domain-containing protein [Candidatus Binatia bacterium]